MWEIKMKVIALAKYNESAWKGMIGSLSLIHI